MTNELSKDLTLRIIVICAALIAIVGLNFSLFSFWKNMSLKLRLVRIQELNTHLREMSTMSAGLAHEIRNPLNIVRGVAQLMSSDEEINDDMRDDLNMISEEVDRVTFKLNELISYSKPISPKLAHVDLKSVINSIARTLESDRDEKSIDLLVIGENFNVNADPVLLRQIIFNIMLNAFQALDEGGKVTVTVDKDENGNIYFDLSDNGPGVPD